ncbi:hypothetical protein JCM14244_07650 [Venenivibrio stagnispumantis]|uniref:Uncharacterized protein n=1 Tax=Venenivibrio stagnispumantis TaxID=407998 RepID=A0AA45WP16_9AQUI|nr:hypothetical protein [Venenivibrio stagnispumantis]MCW4573836.1 hypothetical protein [Venenivibrio stagnispumantis]SMP18864.1 hypothetical protein SAMN06264868_11824 [Venenivibrio stagnispumantis]
MTKKNENRETEIINTLKEIFIEFYSALHDDDHSSVFFTSLKQVELLIEKQSVALFNMIKSLEENKDEEVKKELYKLAKRHFDLGISPKSMFYSIDLYINLLEVNTWK